MNWTKFHLAIQGIILLGYFIVMWLVINEPWIAHIGFITYMVIQSAFILNSKAIWLFVMEYIASIYCLILLGNYIIMITIYSIHIITALVSGIACIIAIFTYLHVWSKAGYIEL